MLSANILKINFEPINSCYSSGAGLSSILEDDEKKTPLLIINNIFPFFKPSGVLKLPVLEKTGFLMATDVFEQKNIPSVDMFICKAVAAGIHVFILLDHYYISHSDKYHKTHYLHDLSLVYGYDLQLRLFYASDNFYNNKYSHIKIPFDEISTSQRNLHLSKPKTTLITFNKSKLENSIFDFNTKLVMIFLDYLDGSCKNVIRLNKDFIDDNVFGFHPQSPQNSSATDGCIFGIDVYEEMQRRVASACRKSLDLRPFHLLWNHKNILKLLINYLSEQTTLECPEHWNRDIENIAQYAFLNRQMAMKYNITANITLLNKINANLTLMRASERNLLSALIFSLSHG